ncbi:hypothetical protein LXN04_18380 [Yersinia pestis subsp. pestis]|nr:hypothetical protein [Yersinia pestis]MCF2953829.1 hypothetical protein [Yersinia pestis subsp. pestis]MCV6840780.1 hypothetical protein [Yersinia pestis subsp. pestis]MCV6882865.1 hypothetical protein [Yersinia pestis subsp. pestis]
MESLPDEYVDVASQITYTAKSDEIKSASENTAEAKAIAGGKDISEVFINPVPGVVSRPDQDHCKCDDAGYLLPLTHSSR